MSALNTALLVYVLFYLWTRMTILFAVQQFRYPLSTRELVAITTPFVGEGLVITLAWRRHE